jgi:hypothetical protein
MHLRINKNDTKQILWQNWSPNIIFIRTQLCAIAADMIFFLSEVRYKITTQKIFLTQKYLFSVSPAAISPPVPAWDRDLKQCWLIWYCYSRHCKWRISHSKTSQISTWYNFDDYYKHTYDLLMNTEETKRVNC